MFVELACADQTFLSGYSLYNRNTGDSSNGSFQRICDRPMTVARSA